MTDTSNILTCNEDCFHCIYPDCIMDVLPSERNRINAYCQEHKEEIKAYQKKYQQKHKEEIIEKQQKNYI